MILSFNPMLRADVFRICADRGPNAQDLELMDRASAVLLPQGRRESLWREASARCPNVFPDYEARYEHPGKVGQARLFASLGLPQPDTDVFDHVDQITDAYLEHRPYPAVVKSSHGGEGQLVFPARDPAEARRAVQTLEGMEHSGFEGLVVQEWVDAGDRSLRVAVVGDEMVSYWRVGEEGRLRQSLSRGAHVDEDSDPELQAVGRALVARLCRATGIDLAGVDVIFRQDRGGPEPLLLEVNHFFGTKGLGGTPAFWAMLQRAVDHWLESLGLPLPTGEIDEETLLRLGEH